MALIVKSFGRRISVLVLVAGIITTSLLWVMLANSRGQVVGRCSFMLADCTSKMIMMDDPYCSVDPICLSTNAVVSDTTTTGSSQGLAILPFDPLLVDEDPLDWFATANLWRFITVCLTVVLLIQLAPTSRQMRVLLCSTLLTWCILELGRWSWSSLEAAKNFGYDTGPASLVLPFIYTVPTYLAICSLCLSLYRGSVKNASSK